MEDTDDDVDGQPISPGNRDGGVLPADSLNNNDHEPDDIDGIPGTSSHPPAATRTTCSSNCFYSSTLYHLLPLVATSCYHQLLPVTACYYQSSPTTIRPPATIHPPATTRLPAATCYYLLLTIADSCQSTHSSNKFYNIFQC